MPISAFKLITPTSIVVAGGTASVGQFGKVSFSAATSLSLNGVFSSTYDNYMIVCRHNVSSGVTTYVRFRANGIDNSTSSSYVHQSLEANSTTVGAARAAENYGAIMAGNATQRNGSTTYVFGPNLAQPTAWRTVQVNDFSSARLLDFAGTHNQSTSYDGFTLLPFGGPSISGEIAVYGCNQ